MCVCVCAWVRADNEIGAEGEGAAKLAVPLEKLTSLTTLALGSECSRVPAPHSHTLQRRLAHRACGGRERRALRA